MSIGTDRRTVDPFDRQASEVLGQLRAALSALIGAIPGPTEIRRAADLERALGIRTTLAWQVFKVASADDPLTEAKSVPGAAGIKRFLEAAAAHGVPNRFVQAVSSAIDDLGELVSAHAGSRKTFNSMVSGLTSGGTDRIDLEHKRLAFMGNAHIFGAQAKTHFASHILHPAMADADRNDFVAIRGMLELRGVRRDALWDISAASTTDDDGEVRYPVRIEPIDPAGLTEHGVALLPEFCTRPLPSLDSIPQDLGHTAVVLRGNGIGIKSATTCVLGNVHRSATVRYQDEHNHLQQCRTRVRIPCAVLIHDVLVYKQMFGPALPEVFVYGDHRDVDATSPPQACDLLATQESVVHLGKGPAALQTPDVPRYPEIVQYAFDQLGWEGRHFDVYRCRVEYPVMPSSVVVQFRLPVRPDEAPGPSA